LLEKTTCYSCKIENRFNYDQVSKTPRLADSTSSSDIVIQLNRAAKGTRKANWNCSWHRINPIEVLPRNRKNAPTTKLADGTFPCSYRNKIYIPACISESV